METMPRTKECELDKREKQLQDEGYTNFTKGYLRLGRALFIVDSLEKQPSESEAWQSPIGVLASLQGETKFDESTVKTLQEIFGSIAFLRIVVEGDPDAGLGNCRKEVLMSGYRYGLDDVLIDGKLVETTHGSKTQIIRYFIEQLKNLDCSVPNWETYDGIGYSLKESKEIHDKLASTIHGLTEFVCLIEHKDDMPREIENE